MILANSQIYPKPFKNSSELLDILEKRGLSVKDRDFALEILSKIGYYRLSAYFIPFYESKDYFVTNTTFSNIYELYEFDRELRVLIFRYLEQIEIALRAKISNTHAKYFGAFGYFEDKSSMDLNKNIKKTGANCYAELLAKISKEKERSNEVFIKHIREKYNSDELPIWALVEILSFGTLSKFFALLPKCIKKEIISSFGLILDVEIFQNWLIALTLIRNTCAHHSRIWNRCFTPAFKYPKKMKDFLKPSVKTNQIFFALSVMLVILKDSGLKDEITLLLKKYPKIDERKMGFLPDWQGLCPWASLECV